MYGVVVACVVLGCWFINGVCVLLWVLRVVEWCCGNLCVFDVFVRFVGH